MQKENIAVMSHEHTSWLGTLDFYKQEMNILKERLTEIAGKNNHKEVTAKIEHFENQFCLQMENIDILQHNINENLSKSAAQAISNKAGFIDAVLVQTDSLQKEQLLSLDSAIAHLRKEFNTFAAETM